MFVCPNCGFRDSPCWRNSRFVIYAVYTTLDELQLWEPEVAVLLKDNKRVEFGVYVYWRRGRANHIYRMLKELESLSREGTEKPKDPFQRKLAEYVLVH